jgi:predicted transcriptional regulator
MNITPKAKEILEFLKLLHEQNRLFKTSEITTTCDCTFATAHKWIREFKYMGLVELEYINATKRNKDGMYKVKSIDLKQL